MSTLLQDTEIAPECAACGSTDAEPLGAFEHWNRTLGSVRCTGCGLVRVSPRFTAEGIDRVFRHYFDHASANTWADRRLPVFRDVLRILRREGAESVYDVGSARGELPAYLYAHGFRVAGCDLSETAVAGSPIPLDLGGITEARPSGFDAVTILDTLYYSPDPVADLQAAREALSPGGCVVLRLRNNPDAEQRARRGLQPGPSDHLWAFTPATARMVVERAGLRVGRMMPASYSRHRGAPVLNALVRAGQVAGVPPLGMSFLLVAHRAP